VCAASVYFAAILDRLRGLQAPAMLVIKSTLLSFGFAEEVFGRMLEVVPAEPKESSLETFGNCGCDYIFSSSIVHALPD
jgi:hypothetical protein